MKKTSETKARLAEALRANLKRRKRQQQARAAAPNSPKETRKPSPSKAPNVPTDGDDSP